MPDADVHHIGPCGGLTDADRELIARARRLADLRGPDMRRHAGTTDLGMAMATALGECQFVLRELIGIIERGQDR